MKTPIYDEPVWRIVLLQHLSYVVTRLYLTLSASKTYITNDWSVESSKTYVIASSHVSYFDPFVATTALGWRRLRALLPCRFMATPTFLKRRIVGKGMVLLGAFSSHEFHTYPYGIDASLHFIQRGHSVVIFPQGKRTRNQHDKAHRGVSVLANTPNTMIIPVLIDKNNSKLLPRYTVIVGLPFDGADTPPQEIMKHIYDLGSTVHNR